MTKDIVVTGGDGFLGKHVVRRFKQAGWHVRVCSRATGVDIRDFEVIRDFLLQARPWLIAHCAAHVGGIAYNYQRPADIFQDNVLIGLNIVRAAAAANVPRMINVLPNCVYPGHFEIYRERDFWNGPVHESVLAYGLSRKAIWGATRAHMLAGPIRVVHLILPNMYGPGDHFDPIRSHALGALVLKIVDAKRKGLAEVEIWGTGKPVREWLYVEDGAEALLLAERHFDAIGHEVLNIGVGKGISVSDMAEAIKSVVGWTGQFRYDTSRPDGAMVKILDASRMRALFDWSPPTGLRAGIERTVRWYEERTL